MGMPACRIGDLTEHGGTIMVGFPTVLIGEMPASRIGDMHVCPMVTPGLPPIPHVGGPFVLGSPTVLVGEMPQSRVTDMLVCVGPPDQAVLGCMTVLVGMAGGAGAAGAGAGAAAMGVPVPTPPPPGSSDDAAGSTQAAQTKATRTPDGSIQTASTVPGKALPPMTLKQPGWPDLPPENTATFSSVQPATVLPGTQLYATGDGQDPGSNSYWSTSPPDPSNDSAPSASTGPESDAGDDNPDESGDTGPGDVGPAVMAQQTATHVAVLTVTSPQGLKAWAGTAAGNAAGSAANSAEAALLVYAPRAAAQPAATVEQFRLPPPAGRRALNPAIQQPFEHLVRMLTAFAESMRASRPAGVQSERWSRAAVYLAQELRRLRSFEISPEAAASSHTALKDLAVRVTQLARTQDGLRFEQSVAAPAEQLTDQRRLVVFAAWQIMQALEQSAEVSR